jgi:hypothetical protein
MLRIKSMLTLLILSMTAGVAPAAWAAVTIQFVGAGSSAMWQSFALAAYNRNACPAGSGAVAPCRHWTGKGSAIFLKDSRGGGAIPNEAGNLWLVWDNGGANAKVWAYLSVDSVVGDRCYFANPRCALVANPLPAAGSLITLPAPVWGADTATAAIPAAVLNAVQVAAGNRVTAALTDIRPEDALFAACRANSALAANRSGLGYNANNPAGSCPANGAAIAHLIGTPILSGIAGSTSSAQPVAFNIKGVDPFNVANPITAGTTVSVGVAPIVFLTRRTGTLAHVTNAGDITLQSVFAQAKCNGNLFAGGLNAPINVYKREPLSGTMNTTEFTVFRNNPPFTAQSQEDTVTPPGAPNNPLNKACPGAGSAAGSNEIRVIGTGQMVSSIATATQDSVGYAFFSFGNVASLSNNASFGYLRLNASNPIFSNGGGDPGDPGAQKLPGVPLPAGAGCPGNNFPCAENKLWGAGSGHLSFPNLRSGAYRSWSVLRLVSDGANLTNANRLVSGARDAAVCVAPDFVPAVAVASSCGISDPGLKVWRSHYSFLASGGAPGVAPNNGLPGGPAESGRDEGGCIFTKPAPPAQGAVKKGQNVTPPGGCVAVP